MSKTSTEQLLADHEALEKWRKALSAEKPEIAKKWMEEGVQRSLEEYKKANPTVKKTSRNR